MNDVQKVKNKVALGLLFREILDQNPQGVVISWYEPKDPEGEEEPGITHTRWFGPGPMAIGLVDLLCDDVRESVNMTLDGGA